MHIIFLGGVGEDASIDLIIFSNHLRLAAAVDNLMSFQIKKKNNKLKKSRYLRD